MRKQLAAATVAVASLAGLGAGFAFASPGLVSAQTVDTTVTTTAPAPTPGAPATTAPATAEAPKVHPVTAALAKLVKDGTITQAQSDAVAKALQDAHVGRGGKDGGHMGGRGGFGQFKTIVDTAAKALGITSDDLMKQVAGGTTVAKIAESKNVPLDTVVQAVVKEASTQIDAAVTAGKLTQAQADTAKAGLTKTVTDFANGTTPFPMGGKHGGFGPGGNDNDADDAATAPTTPSTTTG